MLLLQIANILITSVTASDGKDLRSKPKQFQITLLFPPMVSNIQ